MWWMKRWRLVCGVWDRSLTEGKRGMVACVDCLEGRHVEGM